MERDVSGLRLRPKPQLAAAATAKMRRDLEKTCALQVRRVKRIALVKIAGLVAAAKPAGALFGSAVCK